MKLSAFTIIPPLERFPRAVAFAQTVSGKLTLLGVYAAGLVLHGKPYWLDLLAILALLTFLPQWRRTLVLLGTLFWAAKYTLFDWHKLSVVIDQAGVAPLIDLAALRPTLIAAALMFCAVYYFLAVRWQQTYPMRRPIVTLFTLYFALIACALYAPLDALWRTYLWGFIIVFGRYVWFLCYSLVDRGAYQSDGFIWQLRSYLPFWVGFSTSPAPIAKGAAYLRRVEAKDAQELAVCQIKGIKLLYWAYVLMAVETVASNLVHGIPGNLSAYIQIPYSLHIPLFRDAFNAALAGQAHAWYVNWLSLMGQLFRNVLYLAIWGHVIVSGARMAGFNVLRGTYKPLAAKTLGEFWNRYFYYFKELLVEFFFYPTYLRYFKKHPQVRLFVATLAAAGFGNVLFHFIRDIEYIIEMGLWDALVAFHVYIFYGLVLGTGIGISQLRSRRARPPRHWFREEVLSRAGVIVFYCFVLIFDDPVRSLTLRDNFVFVLSLFNIHV